MAEQDWRRDIVSRYPQFFRRGGYPSVGDGWRDLLERALARFAHAIEREPPARVNIVQIKEKFATLRLYYRTEAVSRRTAEAIQEAVDLAESRSACTCGLCGSSGSLYRQGNLYLTRCPEHAEGDEVPIRPGWKNLCIVRKIENGKFVVGSCRRYDPASDSLLDAPLLPPGFREDRD